MLRHGCEPAEKHLFAGSDSGGIRAAAMDTLIESAKMSQLDPEAYLLGFLETKNYNALHENEGER
jgi:hypothetical protein